MARTKISEFSATPAENTDIDNIDIAEGCAPSGINNAIREMMAQLKDFQTGSAGDPFNGAVNGSVGATTPSTIVATQVDITAQGDLRLQDTTGGQYVALQAPSTVATSYTLTLPVDDGTSGQALITDGSGALSWSSAASGDVYGPASAADNAVARYDGTTGKIIQNSAVTIADDGATVIAANSTTDGLRITQLGTGNALLVEDEANPDSSPFVVDNAGRVLAGQTTSYLFNDYAGTSRRSQFQFSGTSLPASMFTIVNWSLASTSPSSLNLAKSRGATVGTQAIVVNNDDIGVIEFSADDGTTFIPAASILAEVDGTPSTNDMPGRLVFSTTADGASSPTERMRIDNQGRVGIGSASLANAMVRSGANLTGATTMRGIHQSGVVQSDVTSAAYQFTTTSGGVANTAFTLPVYTHYYADQGTFGASATVTNQYGFFANSNLTGATNNYGFYGNIAAGTGRYNFYASGTADNYFGGATTVSVNSTSDALRITQLGTGNALLVEDSANPDATPFVINNAGKVGIGTPPDIDTAILQVAGGGVTFATFTNNAFVSTVQTKKSRSTTVGSNTIVQNNDELGAYAFFGDDGTQFIRGAQITASVDGTPGTNDMPGRLVFSTTADGASSPTERMRIRSDGGIGVGGTGNAAVGVYLQKDITGGTTAYSIRQAQTINSDVTSSVFVNRTDISTQAASFALTNLRHYTAVQGTLGAGSSITNQYGFVADASLIGATNNFGFHSNIASGTGSYNFYAAGTAENYFAGNVGIGALPVSGVKLTVAQTTDGEIARFQRNGGSNIPILRVNLTESTAIAEIEQTGATAGSIAFKTGAAERLRIAATGTISLGAAPGSESLRVTPVASAVNYLNVVGSATGSGLGFSAQGTDTNINLVASSKGSGGIGVYSNNFANLQFNVAHTASAVNYLQVTGSSSTFPTLSSAGSDTNVNMLITTKGTGAIFLQTNFVTQFRVASTASAVNYLQATGGATGGSVTFGAQGSDTNVSVYYYTKAAGTHGFYNGNNALQFLINPTASAVNFLQVAGGAAGGEVQLSGQGSDTNVNVAIYPKGAGFVKFGTHTASSDVAITGYITIKSADGTTRKLAVIA